MMNKAQATEVDREASYRRYSAREALAIVPLCFTMTMILGVLWDWAFEEAIDFEHCFFRAAYGSAILPLAFMVFKVKAETRL